MKPKAATVDDYIDGHPAEVRTALERVRGAIRKAVPKAEETISYGIPAYKLNGKTLIFFAGWKEHYSIYPAGAQIFDQFKDELAGCEISKGTIRFPLSRRVPAGLIGRIAKLRAKQVG